MHPTATDPYCTVYCLYHKHFYLYKCQTFFSIIVMIDDALSIYRHFISLDATQSLGVDETIRRDVESKIIVLCFCNAVYLTL